MPIGFQDAQAAVSAFDQLPPNDRQDGASKFNRDAYLAANPDLQTTNFADHHFSHYMEYGRNEGRSLGDTSNTNPDDNAATNYAEIQLADKAQMDQSSPSDPVQSDQIQSPRSMSSRIT